MGLWFSKLMRLVKGPKPARILMLGLDAAGKTTLGQRFKFNETVSTIPTVGFNVDEVEYGNVRFTMWDVGGQDFLRKLWYHYYDNSDAIIFVVDSADTDRLEIAKFELWQLLNEEKLQNCSVLIFANKQDLEGALTKEQVTTGLDMRSIRGRPWKVQPAVAVTGDGLYEGLEWLASTLLSK